MPMMPEEGPSMVDAVTKEEPKWKGYLIKTLVLIFLVFCGIMYIKDHTWPVKKVDGVCPPYTYKVYGEDCSLKKFARLEEG
jgi:hypothetical protein